MDKIQKCQTLVVTPYYEDIACVEFCKELSEALGADDYIIVVDDGSIARPFSPSLLKEHGLRGSVLSLTRNAGHQAAIACGIATAIEQVDFVTLVVMDSDGEDRPEHIVDLVEALNAHNVNSKEKEVDAVVASRKSRNESFNFKAFYWIYQWFFKILVGRNIRYGNFMALTYTAAMRLSRYQETAMHVAASLMNSRLRFLELPIDRGKRYAGSSKMNMVSLTLHGLRSIMVFAENVLVRVSLFCAAAAALITTTMLIMISIKILGLAIPGWFSTVSGILILLLLQIAIITLLVLLSAGNLRSRSSTQFDHRALVHSIEHVE